MDMHELLVQVEELTDLLFVCLTEMEDGELVPLDDLMKELS